MGTAASSPSYRQRWKKKKESAESEVFAFLPDCSDLTMGTAASSSYGQRWKKRKESAESEVLSSRRPRKRERKDSCSTSTPASSWEYDVFISFRGEDTRKIFVGHLYRALDQKAINTFVDSQELRKGNDLSNLLTAIDESRISILVLSQNYASSTWCLRELVEILECVDAKKQILVPIFYQVDPSHIRNLKASFGQAFAQHELHPDVDMEELRSWKTALTRAANLSGWDSRKYEDDGKLIEDVVEDIFNKLIHMSSSKAIGLVGMDSHMAEMDSLLCPGIEDIRFVGIWGMGGIGKTTIARAVYDEIACQFQHSCFLDNVKEGFTKKGEAQVKEELLSTILREKVRSTPLKRGSNMIMERLGKKKVLLVLDDVDDISQIESLLGRQLAFGGGSRIIITTRDIQSLSGVEYVMYKPKCLRYSEAYELFRQYAFRTNKPSGEFDHLSRCAIEYAQGLPLALKVLGASLHNKSIHEWEDALEKIKKIPQRKIQDVLRTSFDGLDDPEKGIFLDVACFFRGMKTDYATKILDICGFFPHSGLRVLVDRALITISPLDHKLEMHDLLQELGREIGRFSRLWSYEDVDRLLTQNMAVEAVGGIVLKLSNSNVEVCINADAFVGMTKLRLLKIDYNPYSIDSVGGDILWEDICRQSKYCKQHVTGDFKFLSPELRFLLWHGCPIKSLPSNFEPKNLVELDMRCSHIDQLWEGTKPLGKLKFVNLSHSPYLKRIPDFSEAKNLETLQLEGCISLLEVHPSISALKNLVFLSLKGCKELKSHPSSIHMKSLKSLIFSGCSKLEKFPEISGTMKELPKLCLEKTAIMELPSSIENLTGLVTLSLKYCRELKSLPSSICQLKSLESIVLSGCSNFEVFPEIEEDMEGLKELHLDGTSIKELFPSIKRLKRLVSLNMRNCRTLVCLPDNICNLRYLTHLYLSGCSNLYNLPENLGNLESLMELKVEKSGIRQFPLSILRLNKQLRRLLCDGGREMMVPFSSWSSLIRYYSFSGLLHLDLSDCNIWELSDGIPQLSSLQTLKLRRNNFERLPPKISRLHCLTVLNLEACKRLKSILELHLDRTSTREFLPMISAHKILVSLSLKGCKELKSLPSSIHMKSLKALDLSGCSKLEKFPEISGTMKELPELWLDKTAIMELPSSIENLTGLVTLSLKNCRELKSLPSSICQLKSLEYIVLSGCSNFEVFPEIEEPMEGLKELHLDGTSVKELFPSIKRLMRLELLNMRNCRNLVCLPDSICNLAYLTYLYLSGCSELYNLPEDLGNFVSLRELEVEGSGIEEFPLSILPLKQQLKRFSFDEHKQMMPPISSWTSLVKYYSRSGLLHLDISDCNLFEVPEGILHLSSLQILKLSRNKFERLPATMKQLPCLTVLNLEACKRLKSIPELSRSINYIDVHDCTALKSVSRPMPPFEGKLCFTFSNCLQLAQTNLFRDIVETHHFHHQGNLRPLDFRMCLPGNKVPEWFSHQCAGSSLSVQLPVNRFENKLLGFAICAVINFKSPHYASDLSAKCFCTFKGYLRDHIFSFYLVDWSVFLLQLDWSFKSKRFLQSDHMFLAYVPWPESIIEEEDGANVCYTAVTYTIELQSRGYLRDFRSPVQNYSIRSCGVRFIHALSCDVLFSVGSLEMRSRETEIRRETNGQRIRKRQKEMSKREVVTGVSGEGESSELGAN